MECTKLPFTASVGVCSIPFAFACTNRYAGGTACKHWRAVSGRLSPSLAACSGKRAVKSLQFWRNTSVSIVKGTPAEVAPAPMEAPLLPVEAAPIKAAPLFKGEFNDHSFYNRRSCCRTLGSYIAVSGQLNRNIGSA